MEGILEGIDLNDDYKCPNCNLDGIIALCKEKEEKLHLAGEYGLQLQEDLQDSHKHMEGMRIQHEAQMESKIQEIYELKIKLESVERSLDDQKIIIKSSIDDFNMKEEVLKNELNDNINVLKKDNSSLNGQLNQSQLKERQLLEQIAQLEEKNAKLAFEKQKKQDVNVNASYNEEVFVLNEKLIQFEDLVETMNSENVKMKNENEMICLSFKNLKEEMLNKQNELEAAENQSTSYYNYLEKAREETKEVTAELEVLKLQLKQSGHQNKGNSLFGEVEDERMMMEKKFKTMEVKFESISKAYAFLKSQHHNLKSQVTALLSLHSGKADIDYIRNIERALSQSKSENAELVNKLKQKQEDELEEKEPSEFDLKELGKNLPNFESNEDVVEFLSIKFEESKEKIKNLQSELDRIHIVKMAESDKLLTAEQKLHETGNAAERYKNEKMKLRLKLEETESKYKAEYAKRILIEKKFNYDSTNDVEPIGISNVKPRSPPPFMKRDMNKTNVKKMSQSKEKPVNNPFASNMEWGDLVKMLKKEKGIDQKKQDEPELIKKTIRFSESNDVFLGTEKEGEIETEISDPLSNASSKPKKTSFKDELEVISSPPEKENISKFDKNSEVKISSCLKKTSSSRLTKTSNITKQTEPSFKSTSSTAKIVDDKPCDVQ